jgi:hypothetical protein
MQKRTPRRRMAAINRPPKQIGGVSASSRNSFTQIGTYEYKLRSAKKVYEASQRVVVKRDVILDSQHTLSSRLCDPGRKGNDNQEHPRTDGYGSLWMDSGNTEVQKPVNLTIRPITTARPPTSLPSIEPIIRRRTPTNRSKRRNKEGSRQ